MSTATVPRATGYPVPASGAALNSEPVRTQLVNIVDFLEGGNIAQGNIDVTEVAALAVANTWTANQTYSATLTVGANDTGYDVTFYGATAGAYMLWDESADTLKLVGGAATNMQGTLTVGVDDTGYDVQFFGATTGKSMLWDESADTLIITGAQTISETLGVTGAATFTAQSVHTGGIQSGGNIVSDTDSTDDLGTTGVRWANLYVDDITLTTTITAGTSVVANTMTLSTGSIVDSSGAISFGDENLSTTGTLGAGATTVTSLLASSNDVGAIGASGTAFSDLFLASGAVINFDAGDVTLIHSSNTLAVAGGTLMTSDIGVSAGSRIDFDADSDTSIRSTSDDTWVVEAGGQDIFTVSNTGDALCRFDSWGTSVNNTVIYGQPASGTAFTGVAFYQGSGDGSANNMSYDLGYLGSGGYLRVRSADTDGSSTDADVIRIPDGQLTVDGNSTFDDNAFDYVCNDCGWHHADEHTECPECGGNVEWHDDVALMSEVVHAMHKDKSVVKKLEKLGLCNTYGTLDTDRPEIFTSMNKMPWFLMSGMAQLYAEIKNIKSNLGVA